MMLLDRFQKMMNYVVAYLLALSQTISTRRAEVGPEPNPRISILFGRFRETVIGAEHATRRRSRRDAETEVICPKEVSHHLGRCGTNRRVLRIIVWVDADVNQWRPGWI